MLWGFGFVAQKSAMQAMGPLTFSAIRYLLGAVLVTPLAFFEYRRQRNNGVLITRRQWRGIFILCLALFLGVWLQQAALQTASITNGGFLTSLYVIITPIIVYLTARVHPHPIIYFGALLALIGIYLLTGADLHLFTPGDLMLIACAFCWAVQVVMLGFLVKETGMPFAISTIGFFAVAVLSGAGALFLENPGFNALSTGWVELSYAGVLSTAVAFSFQAIGQQYVPPANAAIILSTEALFSAFGGAFFLHERLPPVSYVGAALIFFAIIIVELIPNFKKQKSA
jgi:drug/metabolite transporter (DMT)-like permease